MAGEMRAGFSISGGADVQAQQLYKFRRALLQSIFQNKHPRHSQ